LRRIVSTPGGHEQKLSLYRNSTKMEKLPQYYDPCSELEWSRGKQSKSVTSKRTKWLRNKTNENTVVQKTKFNKTTTNIDILTDKQCKTIKKQKQNNNNNKSNDNTKECENKDIKHNIQFEIDVNTNPFISDKKVFENWYKKVYTKHTKPSIATKPVKISNYYDCIDPTYSTTNISNKHNQKEKSTMPLLTNKTFSTPVFETTDTDETNYINVDNKDQDWTLTNQKEIDKEHRATTEYFSHVYLPRYVPNIAPTKDAIRHTSVVLPLSIKILPSKERRAKFRQSRILYAVLGAMQKVYKETYLGPIDDDPTLELINNVDNIPLEVTNIKDYLALPVQPKQNLFLGKIFIHTNHYLQDYQANELFTDYLRKENIIIEINDLDDVNPVQLGFIENIIPRNDTIGMHQHRIAALMPNNTPKFQLIISSLWGRSGERCKVVMIKCDEVNKDGFLQIFEKMNEDNILSFFPMTDYSPGCSQEQKTTIIHRINARANQYRSILIGGFCDNEDNVPMIFNDEHQTDNILTKTSVTEYLSTHVKNSNGDNLFHFVYPPHNGIREAVVKLQNFSQALSFRKVAHGELARQMDIVAIDKVFQDPVQADLDSSKTPWKPNNRVMNIVPTISNNTTEYRAKRHRKEEYENFPIKNIKASYSAVTAGSTVSVYSTKPTKDNVDINDLVQSTVEQKFQLLKDIINTNKMEADKKISILDHTIKSTSEHTNTSFQMMRSEVDGKINEIKNEVVGTKIEMTEIKTNLQENNDLLHALLKKMNNVTVKGTDDESKSNDVEMTENKQQGGLRVTRSQTNKK
jgi:hypothetical protein